MITHIIFDLSEVLIFGLLGIENYLCNKIQTPKEEILNCFDGNIFKQFLQGEISEEIYLNEIIKNNGWEISLNELKKLIRKNFEQSIDGTLDLIKLLSKNYKLVLLSDHAREWIDHIISFHKFFDHFDKLFFSFDFGITKKDTMIFKDLLKRINVNPKNCLFIDDSKINVKNALSLGIDSIRFTDAESLKEELMKRSLNF